VADRYPIQRYPRGLSDLLTIFGGETPQELARQIVGTLELVDFYGLTQLQQGSANNAALAEGGFVTFTPSPTNWTILFGLWGLIVKTATMTALRGELYIRRGTASSQFFYGEQLGPFGATETGNVGFGKRIERPLILPPGSFVAATPSIIGTDANANVTVSCEFGTL